MTTHAEKHDEKSDKKPTPSMTLCDCTVPPHVTDCADCFGFGIVRGYGDKHIGYRPRTAAQAMTNSPSAELCPTCGTVVTPENYGPATLLMPVTAPVGT